MAVRVIFGLDLAELIGANFRFALIFHNCFLLELTLAIFSTTPNALRSPSTLLSFGSADRAKHHQA
jgi:hypothetical protein